MGLPTDAAQPRTALAGDPPVADFLLIADLRSGIGNGAFYEISLNLELLLWA